MMSWDRRTLDDLADVLAVLYPTVEDSLPIIAQAALKRHLIALSSTASSNWFNILEHAQNAGAGRVEAVVDAALEDYPHHRILNLLRQESVEPGEEVIRGYRLLRKIGGDLLASVYEAEQPGLGLRRAVKILSSPDPAARERFKREASAASKLLCRNIVEIVDHGETNARRPYLVMDLMHGESLARRLAARGRLPLHEVSAISAQVARGLGIMHEAGIVHGRLKPRSVFLHEQKGEAETVKVTAPGISQGAGASFVDPTDRALYLAPEQLALEPCQVDGRADIHALAAILYEVLGGSPAYGGASAGEVVLRIRGPALPAPLRDGDPQFPGEVDAVLRRGLAKDPRDRPTTVAAFQAELDRAFDGARARGATQPRSRAASSPPASAISTGENRICTVMIIDLASAVALSARLDPSEVRDLLDRCHGAVAEPIEALGGYVDRIGGDAAIGVFGAQRASESDAERAIHAALRAHVALAKLRPPKGTRSARPSAAIGISTGRVFIEAAPGATPKGFTVIGEAVIAAGRLQEAAAPGMIVIGRDTCRLITGRFNVEPLPPVGTAGQGEPLQAFRVIEPVSVQHGLSPRTFHGLATKLVGRGAERRHLLDVLDTVVEERRAAHVTLVGPPGVGRSRMLTEIVAAITVGEQYFILGAAQGAALAADTSYGLSAALLRRRFDIPEGAARSAILHRLRRGVRWLRARIARIGGGAAPAPGSDLLGATRAAAPTQGDLDDALIQIAGLLDMRKASPASSSALSPDEDGSQRKHRLAAAMACLVRFAASLSPVVILCDDAQWADDASLDLLEDLILRVEDLPVLVVCAARPDLYERRPNWGEGQATHRRMDLAPLEDRHVEEMTRDRLRRVRALSPGFVRTVAERADGNPLILDETLRFLMDAGVIEVPSDGGAWLAHEIDLGGLTLPATVQGIVQARLDRLDPPARALLERAAVVGKTFWESAVEELRQTADPLAPEQTTAEIIAVLRERQLVRAKETAIFPGERERVFAESATQEVAYDMLPTHVRRPLHLLVARWLKAHTPGDARAALLARHYDLGGDARAAAEAYERAAAHASAHGQHEEALRHLLRVCELHDEVEEEGGSEDAPEFPWQVRVRVRLDLGDALRRLGRLDAAEVAYGEARAGIPAGDPEALQWDARADFRLALSLKVRGAHAKARMLVERAIAAKKEGGMVDELPAMYALLTFLHRRERDHAASWRTGLEGLRVCREIPRSDDRFQQSAARALLGLAPVLFTRGRWIAAHRTYRQAARLAARAGDLDLLGRALNGVAAVLARGDYVRARATYLESLRVKEKLGDLHQIAVAYSNVAEVEIEMNDHAAAHDHARRAIRVAEQIHADSDLAEMYRNLGAASLGLGKIEAALDACLRALRIAEDAGRLYLDGVVETLAKVCARAAEIAPEGAPLRAQAGEIKSALTAILAQSFVDDALRARIEALMGLLSPFVA